MASKQVLAEMLMEELPAFVAEMVDLGFNDFKPLPQPSDPDEAIRQYEGAAAWIAREIPELQDGRH